MMKRIFGFALLILGLSAKANTPFDGEKLEFGLGITPCMSWMNPSTKILVGGKSSLKFGFGAKINYHMSEKYALGFEINLQNLSAHTHLNAVAVDFKNTIKNSAGFHMDYQLRYLDIPIMLKMNTIPNKNLAFYGEFGGNLGILLNQLADIQSDVLNLSQVNMEAPEEGDNFTLRNIDNINTQYDYSLNKFRAGLIFGAGVHYHLGNESKCEIGIRYNLGLSDLYNESKWNGSSQSIGLNIGFIF